MKRVFTILKHRVLRCASKLTIHTQSKVSANALVLSMLAVTALACADFPTTAAGADSPDGTLPKFCLVEVDGHVFQIERVKIFGGAGVDREDWGPQKICQAAQPPHLEQLIIAQWAQASDEFLTGPSLDQFSIIMSRCDSNCRSDFFSLLEEGLESAKRDAGADQTSEYVDVLPGARYRPSLFGRWNKYFHVWLRHRAQDSESFAVSCGENRYEDQRQLGYCNLITIYKANILIDVRFDREIYGRGEWLNIYDRVMAVLKDILVDS